MGVILPQFTSSRCKANDNRRNIDDFGEFQTNYFVQFQANYSIVVNLAKSFLEIHSSGTFSYAKHLEILVCEFF